MKGIKTKSNNKWNFLLFIFFVIILFFLFNSLFKVYKKNKEVRIALARMQEDITNLENKEKNLEGYIQKVSTQDGIKFEIKKKLNVAEVGESVAIIVEEKESPKEDKYDLSIKEKLKEFFSNILDFFSI